jgi:hypothetical protein
MKKLIILYIVMLFSNNIYGQNKRVHVKSFSKKNGTIVKAYTKKSKIVEKKSNSKQPLFVKTRKRK